MIKKDDKEKNVTVKKIFLATVALGFCLLLSVFVPAIASAEWGFRLGDDGYTPAGIDVNFRKIEFFIPDVPQNSGITWSGSGVSNFSTTDRPDPSSSWNTNTQKINPTYVVSTGPAITGSLYWDVLFTGAPPADFRLDYLVYRNTSTGNPAFGVSMSIKNGVPNFTSSGWTALDVRHLPGYNRTPAAVPVPPSVFLLGAGLIGVIVLKKRVHG
jgi:hypothetical protein